MQLNIRVKRGLYLLLLNKSANVSSCLNTVPYCGENPQTDLGWHGRPSTPQPDKPTIPWLVRSAISCRICTFAALWDVPFSHMTFLPSTEDLFPIKSSYYKCNQRISSTNSVRYYSICICFKNVIWKFKDSGQRGNEESKKPTDLSETLLYWGKKENHFVRKFPFFIIFISVFNQLDAQNLFHNKFYFMPLHVSSTCAHHQEVKIALHSLWYRHTFYAVNCTHAQCLPLQWTTHTHNGSDHAARTPTTSMSTDTIEPYL